MLPYQYGPQVCGRLGAGTRREWLLTDGLGGYAMGSLSGLRTRRYHGLLVVSGQDPSGQDPGRRMMALAALDPIVIGESGHIVRLATHEWASGALAPVGHELLASVEIAPAGSAPGGSSGGLPGTAPSGSATWRWRIGSVVLERTITMGPRSVAVTHRLLAGGPVELVVEPLCTWRDIHGERYAADGLDVTHVADGFTVARSYRVAGPDWQPAGEWYLGVLHREEAARGLNPIEDLYRAGSFRKRLEVGDTLRVDAWAGDLATRPAPARPAETAAADLGAPFVVRTPAGPDVVAGYPWFGTWSRDTMISYEGLFLATGRVDAGRELLCGYAATLSEGMLANTADTGTTEYNTADATLWFLHAVDRHVAVTGDTDLAADLIDALDGVVARHLSGTRYGIRVDPSDGLLSEGADGLALTWMDAVVHGTPVTPRRGKAVELNALWINGLGAVGELRERVRRDRGELDTLRERAIAAFRRRFPTGTGWLYDVIDAPTSAPAPAGAHAGGFAGVFAGRDSAIRPNQLFAYGLPYAPLRGDPPDVVALVGERLLTPLGLRTLDPADPAYQGRHRGDPAARDRAYHQGTVWPWLLGAYADAAEAVGLATGGQLAVLLDGLLDGLLAHLGEWGVGSISETADGDAPHEATGCPFQAWSVAELLRLQHRRDHLA